MTEYEYTHVIQLCNIIIQDFNVFVPNFNTLLFSYPQAKLLKSKSAENFINTP